MDRWSIIQAHKYVDEIARELIAAEKRVASLSESLAGGKILPLKPYNMVERFYSKYWDPAKTSTEYVEGLYAEDLKIIEENEVAAENNTKIFNTLYAIFKTLGFAEDVVERVSQRSTKTRRVKAGWLRTLQAIPRTSGAERVHSIKASVLADVEEHRKKEALQREAEARRAEKIKYIGQLEAKYGQTFPTRDRAVDYLLSKDKYLKLAHYLCLNRGDWSEGHTYAEIGLEGFVAEDDTDRAITEEIWGLINEWDGDGRCFRDCTWNYDVLYGMADPELRAEVAKLTEGE